MTATAPKVDYKPIMLVHIYRYVKADMNEQAIADALGVSAKVWRGWKKTYPSILKAIALAQEETKKEESWHTFVYNRLSPDLRELWDRIQSYDAVDPDSGAPLLANGVVQIEALLNKHGKLVRQQLFLYALVNSNFSMSKALAKVNIDKKTLYEWIDRDPKFGELIEEVKWHKANFFEESLVKLVERGDTAATIFANKTLNRDRGYNPAAELKISHSGRVDHNMLDLDDLDLSFDCRKEIMEKMRQRDETRRKELAMRDKPIEIKMLEVINNQIANVKETSDA